LNVLKNLRKKLKLQWSLLRRRVITPAFPKNSDGKVLVHIGCGWKNSPEFVNIDALPLAHIHIITENIASLPDLGNDTVDLIYMCHILEHIKEEDLEGVLSEMKRALKSGGILRLSVPDFDRLIEVYQASGRTLSTISRQLMGGQDFQYNIHYSVFNHARLSELLTKVGFRQILTWDPENCQYHNFRDRASRKIKVNGLEYPISLNLEAIK
jgi:predicted SAM-dependent methyltransferase